MNLDLEYVEGCSPWLDLKIMLRTIPAILALVWEMRIRRKLAVRRGAREAETVKPAVEPDGETRFAGTVPARK